MYVTELRDLITDVRQYLGEGLCREQLSPKAEEERLRLLARLGPQPPAYLDMSRATTLSVQNKESLMETPNCYETMPDSLTESPQKSGSLSRRERFLFLEASRKVWARLTGPELCLHQPGKGGVAGGLEGRPPSLVIRLDGYMARRADQSPGTRPNLFEIVCPGKKTYQFTAPNEDEMLSWIDALNEASQLVRRELPSPPPSGGGLGGAGRTCGGGGTQELQEVYDTPDCRLRPVTPPQEYERMAALYQVIDDKRRANKIRQEQLYKNIGPYVKDPTGGGDDACYYNLISSSRGVPSDSGLSEDIYQTISEAAEKTGIGQSRIQAIIKAMEASIAEAQLYEPIETSQER